MLHFVQIDKSKMKAAGMVGRVRKEVEIHSRLKHPSILEVIVWRFLLCAQMFPEWLNPVCGWHLRAPRFLIGRNFGHRFEVVL